MRAAGTELLWPRACAACGQAPLAAEDAWGGLCVECAETLEPLWPHAMSCVRCAAPLREGALADPGELGSFERNRAPRHRLLAEAPADPEELRPGAGRRLPCRDCQRLDPAVQQIRAAFAYEGALASALMRLKWQGRDDLAAPLGGLLAPLLAEALLRCDVVTPVPLHPSRLRARGYNQAALLLQAALRAHPDALPCRPVVAGLLRRTLATEPALAHGPRARQLRVEGAFAVRARHQPALRTRGLRVLLVDDVVTTGATVGACAAALRAAGATHVEAVALLRASP